MEKEIFPQIIHDTGRFFGYQLDGFWIDVGRIKSYIDVHQLLLRQRNLDSLLGETCNNQGIVTKSSIGHYVSIGEKSSLSTSIVLDNVSIGKQTTITHCVLGENCIIGDYVHLQDCVVGDQEAVSSNTTLENKMVWTQPVPEGYPKKQIGNVIGE